MQQDKDLMSLPYTLQWGNQYSDI